MKKGSLNYKILTIEKKFKTKKEDIANLRAI